jgi:hypothetical protein
MVRLLLSLAVALSMLACLLVGCSSEKAPAVGTSQADVAVLGGYKTCAGEWKSTYGEVTLYGYLQDTGSARAVTVGFYWGPDSVSGTPTGSSYLNHCTPTGAAELNCSASFSCNFTSQVSTQPDTTYYFRAYAESTAGIAWGDEYSFHTVNPGSVLTVGSQAAEVGPSGITGVSGQAFNRTSETLRHVSVTVKFISSLGAVETASYSTDDTDIVGVTGTNPNGGLWNFHVQYPGTNAAVVASYELSFSAAK